MASFTSARSRRSMGRPPWRWTTHRSSNAAMWPRSQTNGLIRGEWTRTRFSSDTDATRARVRSRASRRPAAASATACVADAPGSATELRLLIGVILSLRRVGRPKGISQIERVRSLQHPPQLEFAERRKLRAAGDRQGGAASHEARRDGQEQLVHQVFLEQGAEQHRPALTEQELDPVI